MSGRAHLLAVARGDAEPDLVVAGGRVFSAFTREWLEGDVAVAGGRIAGVGRYDGGERVEADGRPVVPGMIDAHVHLESSKLLPSEFARVVVPRGTTAVVCDPHEVANVLGADGAHWMLDATRDLPLRVYVMASSCVPASALESPQRALGTGEMAGILARRRTLGVAEVMDFPAVIAGDPSVLAKVALHAHVDGHAPGVLGRELDAYAAAGIRSDHESTTWEEALEKRRRGLWVLIREASNARNLSALLELVRRHGPEHCAFCTDDREPDTLVREGHLDAMCRQAVAEGVAAGGRAAPGHAASRPLPRPARPRRDRAGLPRGPGGARRSRGLPRLGRRRRRPGGGARRRGARVRRRRRSPSGCAVPSAWNRRRRTPSTSARPPSACA